MLQLQVAIASCSCMSHLHVAVACRGGRGLGITVTIRSHKLQFQVAVPSHGGLGLGSAVASRSCKAQLQVAVTSRSYKSPAACFRVLLPLVMLFSRGWPTSTGALGGKLLQRSAAARRRGQTTSETPSSWTPTLGGRVLLPRSQASGQSCHVRVMAL